MSQFITHFIQLFMDSAPWLLVGLLLAGLIKAFLPKDLLSRHLGKPGFLSIIKAALLGAPLPLCSCGVVPAAIGLHRAGASKGATTSFLISTPETGVDSISISYALMGPFMAIIRPIAAVFSAIIAGILVGDKPQTKSNSSSYQACCKKTCEPSLHEAQQPEHTLTNKLISGLRFSFFDLVKDISIWLIIGLGFAALIMVYIPSEFLTQWGEGFFAFVVMILIGIPMYICATASTPIAAGLLLSGVSPGAVLIFMLVGPATNIATIGLVKKELGQRALNSYLFGIISVSFIFAYLTNYLAKIWDINFISQAEHGHNILNTPATYTMSVILAILVGRALMEIAMEKLASKNE